MTDYETSRYERNRHEAMEALTQGRAPRRQGR